jgi:hypothetical protein
MLCGSPFGAFLNGSQVSTLPVAMSRRCTPAKPLFCVQSLPSTCDGLRADHVQLRRVDVLLRRQLPEGELLGLAVELDDLRLVHVAEPQVAVAVGRASQQARRESWFLNWN